MKEYNAKTKFVFLKGYPPWWAYIIGGGYGQEKNIGHTVPVREGLYQNE